MQRTFRKSVPIFLSFCTVQQSKSLSLLNYQIFTDLSKVDHEPDGDEDPGDVPAGWYLTPHRHHGLETQVSTHLRRSI